MAFRWHWLLILLALSLGSERSFAAGSREDRAYAAAVAAFQDGMWSRAETEFAKFITKYPKSGRLAEAALLQAQAEFKQGKLTNAIALLTARKTAAGTSGDQYVYWIGEAQFQSGNFAAAAETFASLPRDFPESSLCLQAVVEEAAARARLNEWRSLGALLEETNSVFQRAARMDPTNELVGRGSLMLAQARFEQNDFAGAATVLESLDPQTLEPQLDWQREYLLYQVRLAAGDTNAALAATTNLVQLALSEKNDVLQAEALALRAQVLEQLGQASGAMAACQEIIRLNTPAERVRQAILKMAELAVAQNQFADAEQSLEKYLAHFPGSAAADVALLTLGELQLKDYTAQQLAAASQPPAATNQLPAVQAYFDRFLRTFTNPASTALAGKAHLDRGWCEWLAGDTTNSLADFTAAAQQLPPSLDLATARFKMGDALFAQRRFTNALNNYRRVVEEFTNYPAVMQTLGDRALYQMVRANLELTNLDGANSAMDRLLKLYPASDLADSSILLVGEGLADALQPAAARATFQKFEAMLPNSPLRPEADLAVARTYEQDQNPDWTAAIRQYETWLKDYPTNSLRPRVEYALAAANFQAGHETNAFDLFTNFVAQFPADTDAPLAQLWVADHYFRLGGTNYMDAERNYKMLYQNTNWQALPFVYTNLAYQARLMAGRAAMGLPSYKDAIDHFTSLTSDTNCPPDLNLQALFAYGSALMLQESPDTNKPLANFQLAMNVFSQICQLYPTNEPGALAWCEIGDCAMQLTNYDAATNAYTQAFSPNLPANISARSRAQIGLGVALEKKAALAAGAAQEELLDRALDNYLDVFDGKNLRDGELSDPFWMKKAGLQAAPLVGRGKLNDPDAERKFYERLKAALPQLAGLIDKKIDALLPAKN